MENKKYAILEDNFIIHEGRKLYRIIAVCTFTNKHIGPLAITIGDLGGYVEGYHNLSQEGDCWISNDSKVYGNAKVKDDAIILWNSEVFGNVVVKGQSEVTKSSKIYGNAEVGGLATIISSQIFGNARISGFSCINTSEVLGNAVVNASGDNISNISNGCRVCDNVHILKGKISINFYNYIRGNAIIGGPDQSNNEIEITECVNISDNANIHGIKLEIYERTKIRDNSEVCKSITLFSRDISGNSKIV